jgi:peroxiredoxin
VKWTLRDLGLVLLVVALAGAGLLYWQSPPTSKVKVGDWVPDLVLPSHGGGPLRLSALRGRVVLLTAFRADCEDCIAQMKAIESLHRTYVNYGLAVIGLALDHDRETEDRFLQQHQVTFIVLDDPGGGEASPLFGGLAPPQTYLIDPSGRVLELYRGFVDWRSPAVRERIRKVLQQSGREVP